MASVDEAVHCERRINAAAARLLRVQAHSLDSQAQLLGDMAERLREEAARVEHGGELPNLAHAPEPQEPVMPQLVAGEGVPAEAREFYESFHPNYRNDPLFVTAWNGVAAGNPPSPTIGIRVLEHMRTARRA
jgi:hypothetical protein